MSNKKQTAVEWLYDQLEFDDSISMETIHNVFEQAKEMEKQQIIDAWESPYVGDSYFDGKEYYNETFKQL
jgi:hypothetical protein